MAKSTRQRTAAQRRTESPSAQDVVIQDEQEQEEEIQSLKRNSAKSDKLSRKVLDASIVAVSLLTLTSVYQELRSSLYLLALVDTGRILFSIGNLSPDTVPIFARFRLETIRSFLFVVSMFTLLGLTENVNGGKVWEISDLCLHVLPVIVCAGGWLQKKGEVDSAKGLAELEQSKYKIKGA